MDGLVAQKYRIGFLSRTRAGGVLAERFGLCIFGRSGGSLRIGVKWPPLVVVVVVVAIVAAVVVL